MVQVYFTALLVAASSSAILVGVILRRAMALRLIDVPNLRSSHSVPTPRGGGMGILAGLLTALLVVELQRPSIVSRQAAILIGLSLVVGTVGFIDDRGGLSAKFRLAVHLAAAALLVVAVGPVSALPFPEPLTLSTAPGWVYGLMTALWIVSVTNFFNFMDGVDGLAGGQAVASCAGIALAGWSSDATVVAIALAGACGGFLLYNWPPARVFMGDVGSGSIGFLLGGLPLLAPPEKRSTAVLVVAIGLTFFILDPVLTLFRRALRREVLMKAHREHLYQRLIPAGTSGHRVTLALLAAAVFLSVLGALAYEHAAVGWIAVGASVVLFSIEFVCASRV